MIAKRCVLEVPARCLQCGTEINFTWIIEGTQTRTVAGKPPQVVRAGEVMHEEPLEVGETRTDAPANVLIFRILEKGKPETTRVE